MKILLQPIVSLVVIFLGSQLHAQEIRNQALVTMLKAADFMDTEASTEGGYLWKYSTNLEQREGEYAADDQTVWVQPYGTPSMGNAFLRAYQATADTYFLKLAQKAGDCLVQGQLESGGWDYRILFAENTRKKFAYRVDGEPNEKAFNTTTLDDNTTQEALRFLMRLDHATQFKNEKLHQAILYALDKLLVAQYPNGAWPQRFSDASASQNRDVLAANYPETWSRTWPKLKYSEYYTFNDSTLVDMIEVMIEAAYIYQNQRYYNSALKAGGFILLAQMPEPQPAWAQQYNLQMQPAWARKFEPASVTGGESQGVMRVLLDLYVHTGEKKYLNAVSPALRYLKSSQRKDGKLARFYELKTNKPLYFTIDYQLTYSDANMPTHYGFVVSNKLEEIEKLSQKVEQFSDAQRLIAKEKLLNFTLRQKQGKPSKSLEAAARKVVVALDGQGRWTEAGELKTGKTDDGKVISCQTFVKNMEVLSRYVAIQP